jgi:hypothetical protein
MMYAGLPAAPMRMSCTSMSAPTVATAMPAGRRARVAWRGASAAV